MPLRCWTMHAGRLNDREGFWYFGPLEYVKLYEPDETVLVVLEEDSEGTYWGWIDDGDHTPIHIQPHKVLFDVQFPYGPDAEVRAGRGEIVRLSIKGAANA